MKAGDGTQNGRIERERNLEDNGLFASLWKNCNVVQD